MLEDIIIFKIDEDRIKNFNGSIYEAGNGHWIMDLIRASKCTHAVFVIKGKNIIEAVYEIKNWKESAECDGKKVFEGIKDTELEKLWVGKLINKCYRKQGRIGGRVYASSKNLLEEIA